MRLVSWMGFASLACVLVASCSGTTTGSGVTGGGQTCLKGEVKITGQIGGVQIDQRYPFKGIILNQVSTPKNATVTFASGGQIALQWDRLAANGESEPTRGNLLMPDGPLAGENVCLGAGSTLTLLQDAGQFLVKSPTKGTSCPGSATSGELQGCWAK